MPFEIQNLRVSRTTPTLEWLEDFSNGGGGTTYDVLRGRLDELPVGTGASESCLVNGWGALTFDDIEDPPAGVGFYYLIRGTNGCGIGAYGVASPSGAERITAACP